MFQSPERCSRQARQFMLSYGRIQSECERVLAQYQLLSCTGMIWRYQAIRNK